MAHPDEPLFLLSRFARCLASNYDLSDVLHEMTADAEDMFDAAGVGVSLADQDGMLRFATASNEEVAELELVQQHDQAGPCWEALHTGCVVMIGDVAEEHRWCSYRRVCLESDLRSVGCFPLVSNGQTLGALNVYRRKPDQWSAHEVRLALILADMATSFLTNASRLAESERLNEQLQHALGSRVLIEQAKGILSGERKVPLDEAFDVLRRQARSHNRTLREVSHAVVHLGLRP